MRVESAGQVSGSVSARKRRREVVGCEGRWRDAVCVVIPTGRTRRWRGLETVVGDGANHLTGSHANEPISDEAEKSGERETVVRDGKAQCELSSLKADVVSGMRGWE